MGKSLKSFNNIIKSVDVENRIIEMVGSTEDVDRVGDKMFMAGAYIENYLKNPVILTSHAYESGEKPTVVGKALSVKVIDKQLIFKIQFAETQNAKDWFYLYANKYMNASSIGFNPIKYEPNKTGGFDFLEWELLELSLVSVPCNQNAIQHAYKEGKITKSMFNILDTKNLDMEVKGMDIEKLKELIASVTEGLEAIKEMCGITEEAKSEDCKDPKEEEVKAEEEVEDPKADEAKDPKKKPAAKPSEDPKAEDESEVADEEVAEEDEDEEIPDEQVKKMLKLLVQSQLQNLL